MLCALEKAKLNHTKAASAVVAFFLLTFNLPVKLQLIHLRFGVCGFLVFSRLFMVFFGAAAALWVGWLWFLVCFWFG